MSAWPIRTATAPADAVHGLPRRGRDLRTTMLLRSVTVLTFAAVAACRPAASGPQEPTVEPAASGRAASAPHSGPPAPAASSPPGAAHGGVPPTGGPLPMRLAMPIAFPVSGPAGLLAGCDGVTASGVVYPDAEVEPHLAVNPQNPAIMVASWQQDRWSSGGARALYAATSRDGGRNWTRRPLPFSRCAGGNAFNHADYPRASDPWLAYSPDGVVHAMSLSFSGGVFQAGSVNAMLVSRSFDHGDSWTPAIPLIVDGAAAFNDKNALTADPFDAAYVYAIWDRLRSADSSGPTWFARTVDGGASWQPARPVFDPGAGNQTIGNAIAVLPNGTLVNVFNRIDRPAGGLQTARATVIRSIDRGATWSGPITIADMLGIGARDPRDGRTIRDGAIIPEIAAGADGSLVVVWQDARFSGGAVDGIALSRSTDGGLSWSTPVRVNAVGSVHAFTANVQVLSDGTIAVAYYDLRSDDAAVPLMVEYRLARSRDGGARWYDTRIAGPFDLGTAPNAGGLFLGDYQGLVAAGTRLIPLFATTTGSTTSNRTALYAAPLDPPFDEMPLSALGGKREAVADAAAPYALRVAVDRQLRRRLPPRRAAGGLLPYTTVQSLR